MRIKLVAIEWENESEEDEKINPESKNKKYAKFNGTTWITYGPMFPRDMQLINTLNEIIARSKGK